MRNLMVNSATYQWCRVTQILSSWRERNQDIISVVIMQQWIGYAVLVTFCHHSHTTCHTTGVFAWACVWELRSSHSLECILQQMLCCNWAESHQKRDHSLMSQTSEGKRRESSGKAACRNANSNVQQRYLLITKYKIIPNPSLNPNTKMTINTISRQM